jgi:hypothetical protein
VERASLRRFNVKLELKVSMSAKQWARFLAALVIVGLLLL